MRLKNVLVILFLCYCTSVLAQKQPKIFVVTKANQSMQIDGLANEASWKNTDWSDFFVDIEGEEKPEFDTRIKMLWDTTNLYIFAKLSENHIWGNLKQRDTVIFYNNDFEIFIDPDGDTHNYYELEINVLNTVWDLFLSKPYRNSGKVLNDWNFKGLKSAISIDGTLNNSSDIDKSWSVEIAIPWSFNTALGVTPTIPENSYWRMNFSRVQWEFEIRDNKYYRKKDKKTQKLLPEKNWVWSPQWVINMHEPEHWGYVYFSSGAEGSATKFEIPKDEHIKWYLYDLYRQYLKTKIEEDLVLQKDILGERVSATVLKDQFGWSISASSPFTNRKLSIKKDGKFEIQE